MNEAARRQQEVFRFFRQSGALLFGDYTLKSGRVSPYFFNSGRFDTGSRLAALGEYYAAAIMEAAPGTTIVFGPAYKGIPLCISAAMALGRLTGREIGYLYNRKEAKGHGDQGRFVGRFPEQGDRLVLVDDVITDGVTKLEAVTMLRDTFSAPIDGLVIAFHRMEVDPQGEDAAGRFEAQTGIPVTSLLSVADLEQAMETALATGDSGAQDSGARDSGAGEPGQGSGEKPGGGFDSEVLERIRDYRRRYGVPAPAAG